MLIWGTTIILASVAVLGWRFLKKNSYQYLHRENAPIDIFFRWGNSPHYIFKTAIIIIFMLAIFSLYEYALGASNAFSLAAAIIAGTVLTGGKELLDKYITVDDVIVSLLAIALGVLILLLFF